MLLQLGRDQFPSAGTALARAGIREYWLLNLACDQMVVHRNPEHDGYRDVRKLSGEDKIAPLALPELVIRAAAFFE